MNDIKTQQVAFLTFLSKNGVRVTSYEMMNDGSLLVIYKKRARLYEPQFFASMSRWDWKTKLIVLDCIRYGSVKNAEKARKERRERRKKNARSLDLQRQSI